MQVDVLEQAGIRLAGVRHVGPYDRIAEAYGRLGRIAGPAGLFQRPEAKLIAIFHDSPDATPPAELRSDAAIVIGDEVDLPAGLVEIRLPAGRYARTLHVGHYDRLGEVWGRFYGAWLAASGERLGPGPSFEVYLNDPTDTAPEALRTELYIGLV